MSAIDVTALDLSDARCADANSPTPLRSTWSTAERGRSERHADPPLTGDRRAIRLRPPDESLRRCHRSECPRHHRRYSPRGMK